MIVNSIDYTSIISGGWTEPATEPAFNVLFTTDMYLDTTAGKVSLFKQYFEIGETYEIGLETKKTQYSFLDKYSVSLLYWKPSDWPGSLVYPFSPTYEDTSNEDVVPLQPESLPYNYRLNWEGDGGRRANITADESGYWYFCFYQAPLSAEFFGGPETDTAPLYTSLWTPTYPWDTLVWDLGDGTSVYNSSSIYHTYTNPGVYDVRLTITYGDETASEFKPGYFTALPPTE